MVKSFFEEEDDPLDLTNVYTTNNWPSIKTLFVSVPEIVSF